MGARAHRHTPPWQGGTLAYLIERRIVGVRLPGLHATGNDALEAEGVAHAPVEGCHDAGSARAGHVVELEDGVGQAEVVGGGGG